MAIDIPGADQASVNVVALGVARSDPDYIPGQVATTVLGGGYSARLNQEIRIKRGLSYGAGAGLSAARTTGTFRANADTKTESAGQVLDLIMTELSVLQSAPVGASDPCKCAWQCSVATMGALCFILLCLLLPRQYGASDSLPFRDVRRQVCGPPSSCRRIKPRRPYRPR